MYTHMWCVCVCVYVKPNWAAHFQWKLHVISIFLQHRPIIITIINNTCTHTTCDNHHYKYYHNYTTTDWATGSCSLPILIHLKLANLIFDNFIKSSEFIIKTQKFDWVIRTKFRAWKNVRLTCIVRYPIRWVGGSVEIMQHCQALFTLWHDIRFFWKWTIAHYNMTVITCTCVDTCTVHVWMFVCVCVCF